MLLVPGVLRPALASGPHSIPVRATDEEGNVGVEKVSVGMTNPTLSMRAITLPQAKGSLERQPTEHNAKMIGKRAACPTKNSIRAAQNGTGTVWFENTAQPKSLEKLPNLPKYAYGISGIVRESRYERKL